MSYRREEVGTLWWIEGASVILAGNINMVRIQSTFCEASM